MGADLIEQLETGYVSNFYKDIDEWPIISVVIPVFNAEKYLHKCLNSIINSTLKNIEIICVNDGSEDNSLSILNEYKRKDSRIRVLSQNHSHAGVARNAGLAVAKGEYIHFMELMTGSMKRLMKNGIRLQRVVMPMSVIVCITM